MSIKYQYANLKQQKIFQLGYKKIREVSLLVEAKAEVGDPTFPESAAIFSQRRRGHDSRGKIFTLCGLWIHLRDVCWADWKKK